MGGKLLNYDLKRWVGRCALGLLMSPQREDCDTVLPNFLQSDMCSPSRPLLASSRFKWMFASESSFDVMVTRSVPLLSQIVEINVCLVPFQAQVQSLPPSIRMKTPNASLVPNPRVCTTTQQPSNHNHSSNPFIRL